jgi:hypothetical protein
MTLPAFYKFFEGRAACPEPLAETAAKERGQSKDGFMAPQVSDGCLHLTRRISCQRVDLSDEIHLACLNK